MVNKDYKSYKKCRFCNSKNIETVIDLGNLPLAGGFLKNKRNFKTEKKYPLQLNFCRDCFLLQVNISINPDTLFKNYYYFSSSIKTLVNHFQKNANYFSGKFKLKNKFIVEIGSNDGSFLIAMEKNGSKILGVDPAKNIAKKTIKKIPMLNDYFTLNIANKIVKEYGEADFIFSSNTLAHIENMHNVFYGIKKLLKNDGNLVFEVHYLPSLLKGLQYDMIYHEHQYYYSLLCLQNFLEKFNLTIYDAKKIPIHGGSIQIYATKRKNVKKTPHLIKLLKLEKTNKISDVKTFITFNKNIINSKKGLISKLDKIKSQNMTVIGYGASGRATILSNYCGINDKTMPFVIDDAPAKMGAFMPGTHQKIINSDPLKSKNKPDYILLFAWSFADEIIKKHFKYLKSGGKFIIPLPKPKIIQ